MDCLSSKILSLYVDKELLCGKAEIVKNHLAGCPDCRSKAEELSDINKQLAGSFEYQTLPIGFEQRFYDKVKESSEIKTQIFMPSLAWVGSAIAAALLFLITFYGSPGRKVAVTPNTIINSILPGKSTNTVTSNKLIKQPDVQTARAKKKAIDDLANDALKYL